MTRSGNRTSQPGLFDGATPEFVPVVLSADGLYRYELRRECSPGSWSKGALALFCGANPSKADAFDDDHTIRKEIGFTRRWSYGGLIKLNLMPWRATDPDDVPRNHRALGGDVHENYIAQALRDPRVDIVIAAWGDCLSGHPHLASARELFMRNARIACREVQCLGLTKSGEPRHPLMLGYDTPLQIFASAA